MKHRKNVRENKEEETFHYEMSVEQFINILITKRDIVTEQEFRTLRGQALAGDVKGANKGLNNIILREAKKRGDI